ncbi:MAG: transpeptidase family protein [Acidobacteriaceae bacterium]|nr:transpeptidase family protein [Acidobacteriaceae bacterium]
MKRKISDEEAQRLRALKLEWIEFRTESKRVYAYNSLAAHVLGGVDFEEKGNSGVEQSLDDELTGHPGAMRVTTDVYRRGYKARLESDATPGKTVRLTILSRLQFIAEQELKKAVLTHHCKSGSLVAMDPKTGEILALANYPTYDPNMRPKPGDDLTPRENLAVTAPFEPGSVFKVITVSAAMETTRLRPASIVSCGNGTIKLFGRVIHDHNSYASLPVEDVLARSSNIGAINIGIQVGDANMHRYVQAFGFGKRTGIPLPGEDSGVVRKLKHWQKSSIGSVAMGHEVSVTSVQLAQAASVIANGGYLVRPKLIAGAKTPQPVQVLRPETAITMRRMMEGVVIKPWGTGYRYCRIPGYTAAGKTGTAQIYDNKAHVYTHFYNASFMGFAPVTNPAVVVVVTVNGATGLAGYGGPSAGPVFREVAGAALRLLNIPKDLPDDVPPVQLTGVKASDNDLALSELTSSVPHPLAEVADSGQRIFSGSEDEDDDSPPRSPVTVGPMPTVVGPKAPNFLGMTIRDVMQESSEKGIPVVFVGAGTGLVRSQIPGPGEALPAGERVRVTVRQ